MTLLPDASEIIDWIVSLINIRQEVGIEAAVTAFLGSLIGYADEGVPPPAIPEPENAVNFWDNEMAVGSVYTPDLRRLVENRTSVGVMRGARSRDAFYARTTVEQAKILHCPLATVPGHHQGFEVETEQFVPHLLSMITTLEERKTASAVENE